ncbi:MAG: rRNA maturation RNase YbeY [Cyanobacteriota bacterium]|nr:rRNA maturation RNase YbeY [Cyanobacteriota bacterium]
METAAIDLDLAFSADPDLAPELLAAASPWCAPPEAAEEHWQQLLAGWLGALQSELPPQLQSPAYSLGLSLVGDAEIAELNQVWRAKAGPTDVLAFAAQDDDLLAGELDAGSALPMPLPSSMPLPPRNRELPTEEPLELGDIVISLDTAARQAPEQGNSLAQELLFLASHGLLHLLGWDHPDGPSLTAMLQRQEDLCSSVNVQASGSRLGHR